MKVVNCPRPPADSGITYIGRPSIFGNPFFMKTESTRDDVVDRYEAWVRNQPQVIAAIRLLPEDAILGCYCKPKRCHGDVIVKVWKEIHGQA